MIAIVGIRYRDYTHYTLYRSCLLIHVIAIVRSFLFLDDFEGDANISVAIKSGFKVSVLYSTYCSMAFTLNW